MRVLISTSTFPLRPDDGLPRFVLDLAQALAARCRVTVLAPGAPGVPGSEQWGDVEVRRFSYFRPRGWQRLAYGDGIDVNLRRSWLARLQPLPFVLAQARATRALAAERRVDVVNSHWIVPQGLSAALARGRGPAFRHVVTLHGGDAHVLRRLPFARALARFILSRADAVFTSSSSIRDELDAVLGAVSGARIQPMGVHVARFRAGEALPADEAPFADGYLLYVGRLQVIKGVDHLLRALPRVRERHPGVGLLVVGYGECESALREEALRLGLADVVRFAGRRPADYVARALRGCRVAVVPSIRLPSGRTEGMPTVVLEALAAGARVVATATGGIPDVLGPREDAWLCQDRDPDALAQTILLALDQPDAGDRPSGLRDGADAFDWSRVAERYRETFERLSAS
jgi:glycosyltransferase involved in cell wall biosynthesis